MEKGAGARLNVVGVGLDFCIDMMMALQVRWFLLLIITICLIAVHGSHQILVEEAFSG